MSWNERLVKARIAWNLTQTEAAKRLGITQPKLSQIENSARRIEPELLLAMTKLYRVKIEWIIEGDQDKR